MNRFKLVRWLKGGLWYNTDQYGWIDYESVIILFNQTKLINIKKTEYYG